MKKAVFLTTVVLTAALAAFGQTTPIKKNEATKPAKLTSAAAKTKNKTVATPPVEREKFDSKANPKTDLEAAIARAKRENKRIVLDVGGEWCGWCREMDDFLIRHAELNRLREENYVWLKVNFSEENENREFLAAYPQIKGYPHLFVLEKDGKFLFSKDTVQLEDGGKSYNLQKFADFLNEYAPKKDAVK